MIDAAPNAVSGNQNIDALTMSVKWDSPFVTWSVPTSADQYGDYAHGKEVDGEWVDADETVGFVAPTASFTQAVRDAMDAIEDYTNLDLIELVVEPGNAVIRAGTTTTPKPWSADAAAYAVGPKDSNADDYYLAGDTWFDPAGEANLGTRLYTTVLHEQGHTVGLIDVNINKSDGSVATPMEPQFRSREFSIMSYTSFIGDTTNGANYANGHAPQTFMMWDIATLQFMYGADYTTHATNTSYHFDPATGEMSINGVGQGVPTQNIIFRTIWDGGGIDTYDFSDYATDLVVNLTPGSWSDVDADGHLQASDLGGGPNEGYARGQVFNAMLHEGDTRSLIENAVGGAGDDVIIGNQANNVLIGGGGADSLFGLDGNDSLHAQDGGGMLDGGSGVDWLYAGSDAETLLGGLGADWVSYIHATGSGISASLATGNGTLGWASGDSYGGVENLEGSNQGDILAGDDLANILSGQGGNDFLSGGGGNDVLVAGAGNDTLQGGAGADSFSGGGGTDTARFTSAVILNLATGVHSGEAAGDSYSSIERYEGSQSADILVGNANGQTLSGRNGNDTLYGEGGNDTVIGGDGDDSLDGGSGIDLLDYSAETQGVQASLSTDLAIGLSIGVDVLDDFENVNGTAHADSIWGDDAANLLRGLGGNDVLSGYGGPDTLDGGGGDDTILGGVGDSVIGGTGTDVLRFGSTPVLLDLATGVHDGGADGMSISGVERIEGSTGDDIMLAGFARQVLDGRGGDDTLGGGAGKDTLLGGAGDDSVNGNGGNDLIAGGEGMDTLLGGSGNDVFLWRNGDLGVDLIADFVLGQDRVAFEDFVVSPVLGGTGAASEFLRATTFLGGVTALEAHTAEAGWQVIARLSGVSVRGLDAAIDDGSILAPTPPGGFDLLG